MDCGHSKQLWSSSYFARIILGNFSIIEIIIIIRENYSCKKSAHYKGRLTHNKDYVIFKRRLTTVLPFFPIILNYLLIIISSCIYAPKSSHLLIRDLRCKLSLQGIHYLKR